MKLKEALEKKKFAVTSEVQAPVDEEPEALVRRLELVRGRIDGVAVPELNIEGFLGNPIRPVIFLRRIVLNLFTRPQPGTRADYNWKKTSSLHMKQGLKISSSLQKTIGSPATVYRR